MAEYDLTTSTVTLFLGNGCVKSGEANVGGVVADAGHVVDDKGGVHRAGMRVIGLEAFHPFQIHPQHGAIGFFTTPNIAGDDYFNPQAKVILLRPSGEISCEHWIPRFPEDPNHPRLHITKNGEHGYVQISGDTFVFFSLSKGNCYEYKITGGGLPIELSEGGRIRVPVINAYRTPDGKITSKREIFRNIEPQLSTLIQKSTPIITIEHEHQF